MKIPLAAKALSGEECPYRLISLWDMIDHFIAGQFIYALEELGTFREQARAADPTASLTANDKSNLIAIVNLLLPHCEVPEMRASSDRLGAMRRGLDGTDDTQIDMWAILLREMDSFQVSFEVEMGRRKLLFVPSEKVVFFKNSALFGEGVNKAIPAACPEIEEGGNCFAMDLNAAAVFHWVRALEFGLRSLAERLNQTVNDQRLAYAGWDGLIKECQARIGGTKGPPSQDKSERLEFYQNVVYDLRSIKDIWRDGTMHARAPSSKSDAERVLAAARNLMERLSRPLPDFLTNSDKLENVNSK